MISCCVKWLAVQLVALFFCVKSKKKIKDLARKGLSVNFTNLFFY